VAAVGTRSRLPRLPWYIPAAAEPEHPATAPLTLAYLTIALTG
jgi:hypothetical protein